MKQFKVIANPWSRRGGGEASISEASALLTAKGLSFDLEHTAGPGDATRIARRACGRYEAIVALGGDGTVHEVVQGMVFSSTPLGVIPCGSGNDFVKVLGIPTDIRKAVDILAAGQTKKIDAGRINDRYFANGVGIGFDAEVTRVSKGITRIKGFPLYLMALVKALGRFRPVAMTITMNGRTIEQETFLLTVGNGTTCGGGFRLTPHAVVDDGILDVTVVRPMGILAILRALPHVFRGTIEHVPQAAMFRAGSVEIKSAGPVPVHVDGEVYTDATDRFRIEVVPAALTVIGAF